MRKFKVGDRVRVTQGERVGEVGVVEIVGAYENDPTGPQRVTLLMPGVPSGRYHCLTDYLEKVRDNEPGGTA